MLNVYDNVVELAKKRKMSISQLESSAGLSSGTISKWKVCSPKLCSVKAVADVLKVKVDKLLE